VARGADPRALPVWHDNDNGKALRDGELVVMDYGGPRVLSSTVPKEMDEVLALVGARSRARATPSARVR
jgi:hypothetical protein